MRSANEVIHDIRCLTKAKVNADVLGKIAPQYAVPMQEFIEGIEELTHQFSKDVLDTLRIG